MYDPPDGERKANGPTPALVGIRAYAFAALCLAVALGIRSYLDRFWGSHFPYVIFFAAFFLVAQLTGTGPSLFTIFAGFLIADWFFVAPRYSFALTSKDGRITAVIFFLLSFMMLYFAVRARRALARERRAREELRKQAEARAQLAAIVESSDDAITGKSLDGTIQTWNAAAERLYGYSSAEAIGKSIAMLMPPDRANEMGPLLERVARGEHVSHSEAIRRTKDGRQVEVSLTISPVRGSNGEIVAASTIARDITERKKAEREREGLVKQLKTALAEVKTLSGLLPICAHCKKIRDDQGYWNQIEFYILEHSNASFTHGICPECSKKLYPGLFPGGGMSPKSS